LTFSWYFHLIKSQTLVSYFKIRIKKDNKKRRKKEFIKSSLNSQQFEIEIKKLNNILNKTREELKISVSENKYLKTSLNEKKVKIFNFRFR
jgi:hypothetical protein